MGIMVAGPAVGLVMLPSFIPRVLPRRWLIVIFVLSDGWRWR